LEFALTGDGKSVNSCSDAWRHLEILWTGGRASGRFNGPQYGVGHAQFYKYFLANLLDISPITVHKTED
jgi:hypothetical protein